MGGDRDGNPNVTAAVTREAAVIQAEHALRGLEAACARIGRALTVDEGSAPPSPALRRALAAASAEHPELLRGDHRALAGRAVPRLPALRGGAARRDPDEEP